MLQSKKDYEKIAKEYAEANYIRKYHVKGNLLWFYKSYARCVNKGVTSLPPTTIKYYVNLDTGVVSTEPYKRFMREGLDNGNPPVVVK